MWRCYNSRFAAGCGVFGHDVVRCVDAGCGVAGHCISGHCVAVRGAVHRIAGWWFAGRVTVCCRSPCQPPPPPGE